MEGPMSASLQDQSPLLHTLTAFHTRFCSDSSSATMMPHVWGSNPHLPSQECPQPMDLDNQDLNPSHSIRSDPITVLRTLVSTPLSTNDIPFDETLAIRDAFLPGRGEIRNGVIENSPSLEADVATDMASIFRVWDLNTESLELENGTLTDILTAFVTKTENCWYDDGQGFLSLRPTIDAFDLREMRSALEGQMMEKTPAAVDGGLDVSISALVNLLRSIL